MLNSFLRALRCVACEDDVAFARKQFNVQRSLILRMLQHTRSFTRFYAQHVEPTRCEFEHDAKTLGLSVLSCSHTLTYQALHVSITHGEPPGE